MMTSRGCLVKGAAASAEGQSSLAEWSVLNPLQAGAFDLVTSHKRHLSRCSEERVIFRRRARSIVGHMRGLWHGTDKALYGTCILLLSNRAGFPPRACRRAFVVATLLSSAIYFPATYSFRPPHPKQPHSIESRFLSTTTIIFATLYT